MEKDQEADKNFKKEFNKLKKIKFKKRKLSKESVKITIQEVNENEDFKKIRKSEKIDFKKKILKTLREELNMMSKILQKPFQEHN